MAEPRNYCDEALASVGIKPNSGEGFDNSTAKQPKQADLLVELATLGCELFHDPDDIAYADITISGHRETWPVRRKGFKSWLAKRFYDATGGAPSSEAMQPALAVIEAKAVFEGDEHDISVRVGAHNDRVYVDLRDDRWRAVEISADGWRIVDEPPVRFCRTGGMRPLPEPQRGGSIDTLRPLINVKDDRDFLLVIAWLLAALRPRGPYPILAPIGEAGTAKSTLARILRALVDPNKAPLRSLSRDDRELFISAVNMWVLSFDNVSVLPQWLSDGLCRLATGGGHAARSLYTNSEEALFDAMRPIVLNGIENFIVRGDLADRALVIPLVQIPDNERRSEDDLWAEFERQRPLILGALYDAVAVGIKRLPTVSCRPSPGWPTLRAGARLPARISKPRADRSSASSTPMPAIVRIRSRACLRLTRWQSQFAGSWPTAKNGKASPPNCSCTSTALSVRRPAQPKTGRRTGPASQVGLLGWPPTCG